MTRLLTLADRTAVLFLGVAAGAAIGFAFADGRALTPEPVAASVAPPPPAAAPVAAVPVAQAECAVPFQQQLLATVARGRRCSAGCLGTASETASGRGLYRLLPAKDNFEVVKFSQHATGFTRYASLNLEDHARAQLGADPVDIAVISFGANDTQGVLAGVSPRSCSAPNGRRSSGRGSMPSSVCCVSTGRWSTGSGCRRCARPPSTPR